ncbi:MAG: hypothetical protein OEV78_12070 [Spirochaetia bacterium]|nr:hypothetical protein [Spirochaetia bacterium]
MGENNNFSAANVVVKEKLNTAVKEPALANLDFLSVSSGFYFIVFTLISVLITVIIGIVSYFSILDTVESTETIFKKYGVDILAMSSDTIQNAVKTSKYAAINGVIKDLYDKQGIDEENKMIQEIFYLDRKGSVYAHTDLTKVTNNANSTINRVSSIYNNELFHSGLMNYKNEVNIQPYPYDTFNKNRSYLYLIKYILPREYFETMDYSIPVYLGKKPQGTFHVVINRVYSDFMILRLMKKIFIIWSGSIFFTAFISLLIKLPISFKLKKVNSYVRNYLTKDVNQYIEKFEKQKIKEEIDYIDQKIDDMIKKNVNTTGVFPSTHHSITNKNNIKDAYLIREN